MVFRGDLRLVVLNRCGEQRFVDGISRGCDLFSKNSKAKMASRSGREVQVRRNVDFIVQRIYCKIDRIAKLIAERIY